jgi:hypothetical protein
MEATIKQLEIRVARLESAALKFAGPKESGPIEQPTTRPAGPSPRPPPTPRRPSGHLSRLEDRVAELEQNLLRLTKTILGKQHEKSRRQIWFEAWKTVAQSTDCKTSKGPATWAHDCLIAYDNKFSNRTGEAKGVN